VDSAVGAAGKNDRACRRVFRRNKTLSYHPKKPGKTTKDLPHTKEKLGPKVRSRRSERDGRLITRTQGGRTSRGRSRQQKNGAESLLGPDPPPPSSSTSFERKQGGR